MKAHPRRQCKKVSAAELASGRWPFGLSWSLSFVGPNKTSSTGFFNLGAWRWRLQYGRLGPLLDQALQDFSHFGGEFSEPSHLECSPGGGSCPGKLVRNALRRHPTYCTRICILTSSAGGCLLRIFEESCSRQLPTSWNRLNMSNK